MKRPKGYRTIVVDSIEYHWFLGKRNICVRSDKGTMNFSIEEVAAGNTKAKTIKWPDKSNHMYPLISSEPISHKHDLNFVISPAFIAELIKSNV